MNTKQIVSALVVLLVLLGFAVGLTYVAGTVQPPTAAVPAISPILTGTSTEGGDYHYVENQPYYTIDVVYPAQVSLPQDAAQKAEKIMEQALADDIAQFKKDGNLANLTAEDAQIQGLSESRKYAFGATYEKYETSDTVSYVFTVYQDTLGAHPNSFYQTFTFDQNAKLMQLSDLFKPEADYLNKLSKLSYDGIVAELKTKANAEPTPEMLETARLGTAPTPEALQFFYIEGSTLHMLFPPYQVAAYAAGTFDVAIPRTSLTDILK